jgi:hypothetical protein
VVLTLALGTGANTAIFTLLDQVMLRSLPVERPERLVVLHAPGRSPVTAVTCRLSSAKLALTSAH